MSDPLIVAGVDVGGEDKGYHAVLLGPKFLKEQFKNPEAAAHWCRKEGAMYVGVDAPCGWRKEELRPAERLLKKCGISAFATPTEDKLGNEFYAWMACGRKLFEALKTEGFALFDGTRSPEEGSLCFETYPQAVACALKNQVVSAKGSQKRKIRRELLAERNFDLSVLTNIDWIDAALCALTADYFAHDKIVKVGEPETGFIVVPQVEGATLFPADLVTRARN